MMDELKDKIHSLPNGNNMGWKMVMLALLEDIETLQKRVEALERDANMPTRMR
jgi:hypothetical protein